MYEEPHAPRVKDDFGFWSHVTKSKSNLGTYKEKKRRELRQVEIKWPKIERLLAQRRENG